MAELRSTSPDQTPTYYDSPEPDLESSLLRLSAQKPLAGRPLSARPKAIQLVAFEKEQPEDWYQTLTLPIKSLVDEIASQLRGKPFRLLELDEQNQIMESLNEATNCASDTPVALINTANTKAADVNAKKPRAGKSAGARIDLAPRRRAWSILFTALMALLVVAAIVYWKFEISKFEISGPVVPHASQDVVSAAATEPAETPEVEGSAKELTTVAMETIPPPTRQRLWTDVKGRQVEASLVGYRLGQVALKTVDGSVITTAITKLGEDDRVWLWKLANQKQGDVPLFETRAWTSAKDSKEVLAAVIGFEEDDIVMMRCDGRCFKANPNAFSLADQSYLSSVAGTQ